MHGCSFMVISFSSLVVLVWSYCVRFVIAVMTGRQDIVTSVVK